MTTLDMPMRYVHSACMGEGVKIRVHTYPAPLFRGALPATEFYLHGRYESTLVRRSYRAMRESGMRATVARTCVYCLLLAGNAA